MPKHLTSEENTRRNYIYERRDTMFTAKKKYTGKWEEYEKVWKFFQETKTGEDEWRASTVDGWVYSTIKTAQAAFVDSVVRPEFSAHEKDDQQKTEDMRDLYSFNAEKGNLEYELYFARLDAFKLGNGFTKTIYLRDARTINKIVKFDADTDKAVYKTEEIFDFDDVVTKRVSPYYILIDEMAGANIETARDAGEFEILGINEFKRIYGHLPKASEVESAGAIFSRALETQTTTVTSSKAEQDRAVISEFRFFAPLELEDEQVEVFHYWNRIEDTYEIVANGVPLRIKTSQDPSPNPYLHKEIPYTSYPFSPFSADEFWAAGISEIILSDVKEVITLRNMRIDREKLAIFRPLFVDMADEIDEDIIKLRPLDVIPMRSGGKVTPMPITSPSNISYLEEDRMTDAIKRKTGIDERILGVSPGGASLTATEVSFLREAALRRLRDFAFLYKKGLLREVKLKMSLFKQYYSNPAKKWDINKDTGEKRLGKKVYREFRVKKGLNTFVSKNVKKELFDGEVDIDIDMRVLIPMTQPQQLTKWRQIITDAVPFIQAGVLDVSITKLFENYLSAFDINIASLREDKSAEAIEVAEAEHRLLAHPGTSGQVPQTPIEFINVFHIKRHRELMVGDDEIGNTELENVAKHLALDIKSLRDKLEQAMREEAKQQAAMPAQPMAPMEPGGALPSPMLAPGLRSPRSPVAQPSAPPGAGPTGVEGTTQGVPLEE